MVNPWDTALIGDFLDFKNGLNKGKEFFGYGTPIVNYTDVYKKRGLKKADIRGKVCLTPDEIHRFDVRKNDVFFTRTSETPDEVGMSSVLLEDVENGVFSGFVLRGRPKNDMFVPEYCKYCFSTEAVRNAIITGCTYTTRALTNGKQLSAIELPVPPKPEQEAIAEALSDIDTLIVNLEKLIAKKKAIKQGAMQELLTGKRRLPGFYDEWIDSRIGDICELVSGGTPSTSVAEYWDGDIAWCTPTDITGCNEKYLYKTADSITLHGLTNSAATILPEGALLLCTRATIGAVKIAAVPICTNQGFKSLVTHESADNEWLYYAVQMLKKEMVSQAIGSTFLEISKKALADIRIQLPSKEEQKAIASILSDMDSEISALEEKLTKARFVKSGMMSELLTGHIRLIDKEDV